MHGAASDPRPEDFGVTADQVARARFPFLSLHRAGPLAAAYVAVLTAVFAVLWQSTGSIAAAAFFAPVIVAAGSILLVPLLVCVLCASERAQRNRLCRRIPELAACTAFRDALEAARARRRPPAAILPATRWPRLSATTRRLQLLARLEGSGVTTIASSDRERSGWDLLATVGGRRVVLRCWSGGGEVPASIGREMVACLADGVGDEAWVVATADAGAGFLGAVGSRPITVVHPDAVRGRLLGR